MAEYGPLTYEGPPPASGAWRAGFPVGRRSFLDLGAFTTESGFTFPDIQVAYQTWGTYTGSNAVYICHALTGDAHVSGPAEAGHMVAGWWDGLVGPGKGIDTNEWFVVCANVIGGCQGTTGPSSPAPDGRPWGSRFPRITVADMVVAEHAVMDALGIDRWALMLGPSLGGMRVLEWMVRYPERVGSGLVLGTTAAVSADQIGTHETQIAAIAGDVNFRGGDYYDAPPGHGPHIGMGIARRIAHLTYRSEAELDLRFGRQPQTGEDPRNGGRFAVTSYLDHQADKLSRRFDANTYITLTNAMTYFDLGDGRGGIEAALAQIEAPLTVVGIDSDRLFPMRQQQTIVDLAPGADVLHVVHSLHGHDGFLVEDEQITRFTRHAIERARAVSTGRA